MNTSTIKKTGTKSARASKARLKVAKPETGAEPVDHERDYLLGLAAALKAHDQEYLSCLIAISIITRADEMEREGKGRKSKVGISKGVNELVERARASWTAMTMQMVEAGKAYAAAREAGRSGPVLGGAS